MNGSGSPAWSGHVPGSGGYRRLLLGLFLAGALVSRFTDRSALYSGGRQLVLGAGAAALTYAVGALVGTGV